MVQNQHINGTKIFYHFMIIRTYEIFSTLINSVPLKKLFLYTKSFKIHNHKDAQIKVSQ